MERHILTKEELKALREAGSIVFKKNKIKCIKEETDLLKEQTTTIPVTSNYTDLPNSCSYVRTCCQVDAVMATILHQLKPNDEIYLIFYKDGGTSDLLKEKGLHGDILYLNIHRGKKLYQYIIGNEISLDNSARMIQ